VAGEATGLSGWQGEIDGVTILGIRPLDRREMYESDELRQVVVSYDYLVTMRDTA
jgi:hypothetical protein